LAWGLVVAAAIGVINRQREFALRLQSAPLFQRSGRVHFRRRLGQFSLRPAFVVFHGVAWTMNDEDTAVAGGVDDLVHPRRHLRDALGCSVTPVLVPHIADYDGGPFWLPLHGLVDLLPICAAIR